MELLFNWLAREGWILFNWWLLVTLAGAAVMPLCARLLASLPDRGYILARTVGLLVVGFVFWLLTVMGFLRNTNSSIALAWLVVLVGSLALYRTLSGERFDLGAWWQQNKTAVITAELLFIVLLFSWALVRAAHPSLVATEKPMELAFISASQRSDAFPPDDPWMSGYAISYYHFGYIMSGALANLSGVDSPVAFNMMIALLFALTGLNTFGVVYNLVRAHSLRHGTAMARRAAVLVGLLGAFFVVLMGNFQTPLIELPYQSGTASDSYFAFWDVQERYDPPARIASDDDRVNVLGVEMLDPARWSFWWWFRASRVINDRHLPRTIEGEVVAEPVGANVIDEFPQFSFLLADVHPHVLALPFAVMAIGLALNILFAARAPIMAEVLFYGLAAGGLVFLNIWDGPIYMVVLAGAEGLRRLIRNNGSLGTNDLVMIGLFFVSLVGLTFLFYLPFLMSFRSQASGFLPNLEFPTLFRQYFIMFGPFILLLTPYLLYEVWRGRQTMNWRTGISSTLLILVVLLIAMLTLTLVGYFIPAFRETALRYITERGGLGEVMPAVLQKRLTHGLTTLLLAVVLVIVIARLLPRHIGDESEINYTSSTAFALFLIACGAGITLVPEFVYLRDNFGVRINTVFKFYYQGWVMFSIASAFAVYMILAVRSPGVLRTVYAAVLVIAIVLGAVYPVLGIHNRTQLESGRAMSGQITPLTLDGGPSLVSENDYQAIMCLDELVGDEDVVVAEAIGPAYRNQFGRVGVLTGIPIVLGWEGHQRQWRGPTYGEIAGTRRQDIERLYNEVRFDVVLPVIEQYGIDYIFYGTTERYGTGEVPPFNAAGEEKFRENLDIVCEFGDSLFYRVPPGDVQFVGVE